MKVLTCVTLALASLVELSSGIRQHAGCGFEDRPASKIEQVRTAAFTESMVEQALGDAGRRLHGTVFLPCELLCDQCIEILVYWHRIYDESEVIYPAEFEFAVLKQLEVLNARYKGSPFKFLTEGITYTENTIWANDASQYWNEIGTELRQGTLETLNVYAPNFLDATEPGLIGIGSPPTARFPLPRDGVIVRNDYLPNGVPRSEGLTVVHEVGHWLGLLHTFAVTGDTLDPCSVENPNDYVDDTPRHNGPSRTDPDLHIPCLVFGTDTCLLGVPGSEGLDPVYNYMNYVNGDDCQRSPFGEFTCGQFERMYAQWFLFRDNGEVCASNEFQLQVNIIIDDLDAFNPATFFHIIDPHGDIIFNSRADLALDVIAFPVDNDAFNFNLCLPKDTFMFTIVDDPPFNGLNDVTYRISIDGVQVKENIGESDSFSGYLIQPVDHPEWTDPGDVSIASRDGTGYSCQHGYSLMIATLDYTSFFPKESSFLFVLNSYGESVFDPFYDNVNEEATVFDDTVALCLREGDAYTVVHWYNTYVPFNGDYTLFLEEKEIHNFHFSTDELHNFVNGFLVEVPIKTPTQTPVAAPITPAPTYPTQPPKLPPTHPHPDPPTIPHPPVDPAPLPPLVHKVRTCTSSDPCDVCEGDCNKDSDCDGNLGCFKKGRGDPDDYYVVPGCYGVDKSKTDWCVDPAHLR